MTEPIYYAKGGEVRKRSVETKKDENSSSFSLDYPICTVNEIVGNEAAQVIADALNGSEALLEALKIAERLLEPLEKRYHDDTVLPPRLEIIRAAIAKATTDKVPA